MLHIILLLWPRNLVSSCNRLRRGWGAGSSYELDAARSNQNSFIFLILDLSGGFSLKA